VSPRAAQLGTAALAGALFGVGLPLSGMTAPLEVLGFLDFAGDWDPSLLFVMAGAVGVHFVAYRWIRRRSRPLFAEAFAVPAPGGVDRRLLVGSAVFGIGWGLAGYCPGPGIASLGSGGTQALVFVVAMLAGLFIGKQIEAALARRSDGAPTAGRAEHGVD
jgi:uncharacterized membrane protein YedE/YeeE